VTNPDISVVIPTHNRPEKLSVLLRSLLVQSLAATEYEILVVDDGSAPPIALAIEPALPERIVIRLEGRERSIARNTGAAKARGRILVFLDDDMEVGHDFLATHQRAHDEWPVSLAVGLIRLPETVAKTPLGRFRRHLDDYIESPPRGVVASRIFCAAGNMSILRDRFQALGGFDPAIISSEDQDLALRHTAENGVIVFVPEARTTHHDNAIDIRNYCRRSYWGAEKMIPFCRRYPDWPENIERERINGFHEWRQHPIGQGLRKTIKATISTWPLTMGLFLIADLFERFAPENALLERVYRLLLGSHIFRGYRAGVRQWNATNKTECPSARPTVVSAVAK
jgi:glycosyltransferase involved in cell wall biosynthesis